MPISCSIIDLTNRSIHVDDLDKAIVTITGKLKKPVKIEQDRVVPLTIKATYWKDFYNKLMKVKQPEMTLFFFKIEKPDDNRELGKIIPISRLLHNKEEARVIAKRAAAFYKAKVHITPQ